MTSSGLSCPVEECEKNRGGYCGVRGDVPLGFAAAAYYLPGQSSFMAPFAPAAGVLAGGALADGKPPMTDSWGMWRNCPRLRADNPRR